MKKYAFGVTMFATGVLVGALALGANGQDSKPGTMRDKIKAKAATENAEPVDVGSAEQQMAQYNRATKVMVAQNASQYEVLKQGAATWDVTSTMFAGTEKVVSQGVETGRMIGDYWLVSDFEGESMGAPFAGHLIAGFDPMKGKHVGVWVDTMGPFMMTFEGDYDEATKTLTMHSEMPDPVSGQYIPCVMVKKAVDADTYEWTMNMVMGDQEVPMMHQLYKRRK